MKRLKILLITLIGILVPMIATLTYLSPISNASSFVYQYGVTNGAPPFVTNIDGVPTEVYCSQQGGSLWSSWRLTFYSQDTHNMSPGLAYALSQCCSINSRQNLIWMSEISDNIKTGERKPDYADAVAQFNKIDGFNSYYNNLQQYGKEIKFEETEASLQGAENNTFKLGPFKLSFYKSSYSKISRLYLQTDDNRQIEVTQVNFGGYTGSVSDIDSGEEFYVLLSKDQAGQATKVKLVADFSYIEASGTYTYYKPDSSHQTMDGRTVQRLVTVNYDSHGENSTATGTEIVLTIDLAGKVFKDNPAAKNMDPDGIISTGDEMLPGIEVTLFDASGKQVELDGLTNPTKTDNNGYYEFKNLPATQEYYVRFKYNGQLYEPTTYQRVSKVIDNQGNMAPTTIAERSYATDGKQNRKDFNNKFTPVDETHTVPDRDDTDNEAFTIYAYTGPNGMEDLLYYGVKNSKEELQNINFGIIDREQFDLNLRKDLVQVDMTINGKSHTYQYNGTDQVLDISIRGVDIPDYNRAIRSSDLAYKANDDNADDKLQVLVTYKIQLFNESVGEITGYVTNLKDYYDTSYEYIRSWDENNKEITWEQSSDISGSGKTYHVMSTTSLQNDGITDRKWVFVQYKVTNDTLRDILEMQDGEGETEENFAEIAGYRNTYTNDKKDLNGQLIVSAGENAGLIDVDSTPANMNPTEQDVQDFVAYSKTDEYQNLGGEEKTSMRNEIFEDDADVAPGLRITKDDKNKRQLTGSIFEDAALEEKLEENERIGNGSLDDGENMIEQVKVQLICTNPDVETKEVRADENGNYLITDYIPGDYTIKFTYGDFEVLKSTKNVNMYTGQDYKSTLYYEENYQDDQKHWYNNNVDTRVNDAKDEQERREAVNNYSKDLKYTNATLLNTENTADDATIQALADNTYMTADTAEMAMEIEYVGQENTNYLVRNIDFGIIERPRSDILVEKRVSHLKLTTAGDGQTIFDTNQSVSDLAWLENKRNNTDRTKVDRGTIQATIDENLMHGASLEITFAIKVTNTGETDYTDETYYNTGVVTNANNIVTLKPANIIDYVSNNILYDQSRNSEWQEVADKTTLTSGDDPYIKPIDEKAEDFNSLQKIVIANSSNPILTAEALVPESAKDKAGKESSTPESTLILTKVLANDGENQDNSEYENTAEAYETINTNGRRTYNSRIVSIPGNFNVDEPDTAVSERVSIVPPFGAMDILKYTLIGIAAIAILAVGIFVIKRKVVDKK